MTDSPAAPQQPPATVENWRALVRGFEGRGMMLRAYDAAARALEAHSDDKWLRHRNAVLPRSRRLVRRPA
jgi:hypothetical protein